jgi:hypothetical protein
LKEVHVTETLARSNDATVVTPEVAQRTGLVLHVREALQTGEVEVFRAGEFPDDIVAGLEDSRGKFGMGVT